MTDPERQAARQLYRRIYKRLYRCGGILACWRARTDRTIGMQDALDLDESRLIIRRLLAEIEDD